MAIYIVCDTSDAIVDIYSNPANRTAGGQAALDGGGTEYDASAFAWETAPRVGDYFDNVTHTADAPSRAIEAAIAAEHLADRGILDALRDVEAALEADVGAITLTQVQNWLTGINNVTGLAEFRTYEKRATLFLLKFIRHYLRGTGQA